MNEENKPILTTPNYYWGCCMVCRESGTPKRPLKRCSRCLLTYYCSVEHQKKDWKIHKEFCGFLSVKPLFQNVQDDPSEWMSYRLDSIENCISFLGRKLLPREMDTLFFPKVCRICRVYIKEGALDCSECWSVTYCSEKHQNSHDHAAICKELKFAMACDNYECSISVAAPGIPSEIDKEFYPHFSTGDICSYLLKQKNVFPSKSDFMAQCEFRFLTDRLSGPLSILYAAVSAKLNRGKHVEESKSLCIHIPGSDIAEMLGIIKFEYILHRLPKCESLKIVFIGPNLNGDGEDECSQIGVCEECRSAGRRVFYEIHKAEYKDYVDSLEYCFPDIIVAFNCGFRDGENNEETGSWKETLPVLTSFPGVPFVFTSFSLMEAQHDMRLIKAASQRTLNIVLSCVRNPYRSHRPVRDPVFDCDVDVCYNNQYMSVVK